MDCKTDRGVHGADMHWLYYRAKREVMVYNKNQIINPFHLNLVYSNGTSMLYIRNTMIQEIFKQTKNQPSIYENNTENIYDIF